MIPPKISINKKYSIVNIGELIYESIELERSFSSTDFDNDKPKSWISTTRHLSIEIVGNFGSTINSNLESSRTNSNLEYLTKYSNSKINGLDFELFMVESSLTSFDFKSTHQDSIP
jgi:hypothetical protein